MKEIKPDVILDCSGLCCSIPFVKARSELDKLEVGQILEVIATSSSVRGDMTILTRITGHELVKSWKEGDKTHFTIKKVKQ